MKTRIRKYIRTRKKGLTIFFLTLLFVGGFFLVVQFFRGVVEDHEVKKLSGGETTTLSFNGKPYTVALSNTDALREQGLSDTLTIPYEGMLFVFAEDGFPGFWMEDMNYSIDIIWIDKRGEIVDIMKDVAPRTYPKVFYPKEAVRYVLEMPNGFSEREGIQIGSHLDIDEDVVSKD